MQLGIKKIDRKTGNICATLSRNKAKQDRLKRKKSDQESGLIVSYHAELIKDRWKGEQVIRKRGRDRKEHKGKGKDTETEKNLERNKTSKNVICSGSQPALLISQKNKTKLVEPCKHLPEKCDRAAG